MHPKERFEVNVMSIGLVASIMGVIGLIGWLASHSGQQLAESSTLLMIGLPLLADPSKLSDQVYKVEEAGSDKA